MAGAVVKSGVVRYPDSDGEMNSETAAKMLSSNMDQENLSADGISRLKGNRPPPLEMPSMGNNSGGTMGAGSGNNANAGVKTPTPGPSSATGTGTVTVARSKSEREKKIGHRRVTQGGDVTYKKIETSQIMGSIQLGVQHAIGGLASKPERDLLMQDFMTVEQTFFPSSGSNCTPAHHYSEFRFKTYAPIAFRYFRDLFGIQPDDFLMSMCYIPMRELSNPGASGSIFYLTDDDEFIVKTVQHKECEFLQKLLPGYYMNLNQNPRTLLPKFFGLFNYQCNSKNVRLVVMNNLLPSSVKMHQKYDIKGSTYKRKASKAETQKAYPTYKDLDFVEHHPDGLLLEADTCKALLKTMERDCRVLESFKIMDYSLLVGIHNLDIAAKEKARRMGTLLQERRAKIIDSDGEDDDDGDITPGAGLSRSKSINRQKLVAHSTALESIQAESEPIDAEDDVPPGGIPARNAKGERLLLFLGLIDILQSYRLKKKLEHTLKAMIHDGDTVSVHRPGFYAERFMNFASKNVFRKIPSLDLPEIKGNHRKFRNLVSTFIALKHSPSKKRSVIGRPRHSGDNAEGQDSNLAGSPPLATSPKAVLPAAPSSVSEDTTTSATSKYSAILPTAQDKDKDASGTDSSNAPEMVVNIPVSPPCSAYPSILSKERPSSSIRSKVPPPVPPRTPKRAAAADNVSSTEGVLDGALHSMLPLSTPPPPFQEVAQINNSELNSSSPVASQNSRHDVDKSGSGLSRSPSNNPGDSETISISDVIVETRRDFRSSLSVASSSTTSGVSSGHGPRMPRSPPTGAHDPNRNTISTPTWTEGTPSFTESSNSGDLGCPTTPTQNEKEGISTTGKELELSDDEGEMV